MTLKRRSVGAFLVRLRHHAINGYTVNLNFEEDQDVVGTIFSLFVSPVIMRNALKTH